MVETDRAINARPAASKFPAIERAGDQRHTDFEVRETDCVAGHMSRPLPHLSPA
jgi:hypothetical protein